MAGQNSNEPDFQVQQIDPNTLVIRQSITTNFEAPFLYLLFGQDTALLIDSGAGNVDVRSFVDEQIERWSKLNQREPLPLVVMHSHAHGDHVAGDEQLSARPDTTVVGHDPTDIAAFFGIMDWPDEIVAFDLGERIVNIIPTPGHQESHVMVYDAATRSLFSGDVIYPGRLYFKCEDVEEFRRSYDRVAGFVATNPVNWVLGAHIELANEPGKSYSSAGARYNEKLLEMAPSVINDIRSALTEMGDQLRVTEYQQFILFPYPSERDGKSPPDWCLD